MASSYAFYGLHRNKFFLTFFADVAGSSDHCVMFWICVTAFPGCCMSLNVGSRRMAGGVLPTFSIFFLK